ncbi:hypothetical protein EWM64_g3716 [Hericium alpestre]|uniref:Uncharacterized protein n=1 Tax=Hericium alpestre TaxID=135208 RepID=A0A4Z0A1G0_9AGAM|nr:hypothetical protein EWM64_g3716 [Hericium alpestre]
MATKRLQPVEDKLLDEGPTKKVKVEAESSDHPLPNETLHLSALRWIGDPTVMAGGDSFIYGTYIQALKNAPLSPVAWSDEHNTFVYRPPPGRTVKFVYRRASYGLDPSDDPDPDPEFAIVGDAEMQDPLMLLHRPSELNAFSATFKPPHLEDDEELDWDWEDNLQPVVGPPFVHWTEQQVDIMPTVPSRAGILFLEMPDLEAHRAELARNASPRAWGLSFTGKYQWNYWNGDWARAFIQQARTGQPLSVLDKPIIWDLDHVWGVKLRLAPVRESVEEIEGAVSPDSDAESESGKQWRDAIYSYRIVATVEDIYVSPKFFEQPEQSVEPDTDAETEEGSEVEVEENG